MAMAGLGCRAPSAILVGPAGFLRFLPCCGVVNPSLTRNLSRRENSGRVGSTHRLFGQILLAEEGTKGTVIIRSLQQRFFVKAVDVSGPGAVDSPLMQSMQAKIKEDLNAESVIVKDAYGDGRHVSINVVASIFEGKSAVNRQRLVYKAIWQELQGAVHAVDQLKTHTPSEAANLPDF